MAQSDVGVDGFWILSIVPWADVVIILANCRTTCGLCAKERSIVAESLRLRV